MKVLLDLKKSYLNIYKNDEISIRICNNKKLYMNICKRLMDLEACEFAFKHYGIKYFVSDNKLEFLEMLKRYIEN